MRHSPTASPAVVAAPTTLPVYALREIILVSISFVYELIDWQPSTASTVRIKRSLVPVQTQYNRRPDKHAVARVMAETYMVDFL